jgi:hypothetical protein
VLLGRSESGPARCILAWSKFLQGEHGAAAGEFCASLTGLVTASEAMTEKPRFSATSGEKQKLGWN